MKKLIITSAAITAIMAIGILITGCGQSGAIVNQPPKGVAQAMSAPQAMTDEQLIDQAWRAAYAVTGLKVMVGEADSAQLAAELQKIDEARQALQQLEEARRAAYMVTGTKIMQGLADGAQLGAEFQKIDEARQAVLARIGLTQ